MNSQALKGIHRVRLSKGFQAKRLSEGGDERWSQTPERREGYLSARFPTRNTMMMEGKKIHVFKKSDSE